MRIEFEAFGDKIVSRNIMRIGQRSVNMVPVFMPMSKFFYALEKQLFATAGASGEMPWQDTKDETKQRKARSADATERSNADKILRAKDVLMKSLTRPNAKFSRRRFRPHEMFLGTTDPKAVHHYYGAPAAHLPMRRPIVFRNIDKVAWVKMAQEFLITGKVPAVPVMA